MRRLIMWNLVTLDGLFEGPQPWDLSFHEQVWCPELEALSHHHLAEADLLVFGRKTYEGMAAYWTAAEGPTAEGMNRLPKVVCSRTLTNPTWGEVTVLKEDVAGGISRLKQEGEGVMFVFGSGELSQMLMRQGLFDEYRLAVAPVILGQGRRLFESHDAAHTLKLLDTHALPNGGVILRYVPSPPAGAVAVAA